MVWCECQWHEAQGDRSFTAQAVASPLLIRYRSYLQTTLWQKPATVYRAHMSLKRYFFWATKTQLIQYDPTCNVKFVPQEAPAPQHLSGEEDALLTALDATGTFQDQSIIALLYHAGLRARELYTLTYQQAHLGKRNGTLHVVGKRKKSTRRFAECNSADHPEQLLRNAPIRMPLPFSLRKNTESIHWMNARTPYHQICSGCARRCCVPYALRHRFGYRMTEVVSLQRLAQYDSLDTTLLYIRETKQDLH